MRASLCFLIAALSCIALAGTSDAADRTSVLALLKKGYEIKSTSFLPLSEIKTQRPKATEGVVLLTLQKGISFAVCEINWVNWSSLAKPSMENETLCDVR